MGQVMQKIDNNPLRLLQGAAHRQRRGGAPQSPSRRLQVDDNCAPNALLMPNSKILHQLWEEYTPGIGNNKPAKFFTRAERGRYKFKYLRQKIMWDLITVHVCSEITASMAIDRIYNAYGHSSSITTIIIRYRNDKKNGTIPEQLWI